MPNIRSKDKKSVGCFLKKELIDSVTVKCQEMEIDKSELIECIFLGVLENDLQYKTKSGKIIEISINIK